MIMGWIRRQDARDDGRLTLFRCASLISRSLVVGLGTTLVAGIVLSSAIPFVAGLFRAPEFIALRGMGFVMAGALGILSAVRFLFHALRQVREEA